MTKWKNLRRETGGVSPGKIGGHKKPVLSGANADWLRKRIRSGPFTLRKLAGEVAGARDQDGREHSVDFCSSLWNQLPTEPAMPKQKLTRNLRILAEFYFRNPSA